MNDMNDLIEKFQNVSIATIATHMFTLGFRSRVVLGLSPLHSNGQRMIGPAFTLRFIPSREDIDTMASYKSEEHLHRRAMEECPPGHVLVIDARGDASAASAGDIMLSRLQQRGGAGVVTDGGFRDTQDIRALDFPAYHRQPASPSSPIHLHPAELNVPIGCGGVAAFPGDIVVGDDDGVVIIPEHLVDEVAAATNEMTAYEEFATQKVTEGRSLYSVYPATDASRSEFEQWAKSK